MQGDNQKEMGKEAISWERKLAPWMLLLTLLVIPSLVLELSSNDRLHIYGYILNWIIWVGFVIEAIVIAYLSKTFKAYTKYHLLEIGLILFTFPLLPVSAELARALRVVRLLRLLRLPKAMRNIFKLSHLDEAGLVVFMSLIGGSMALAYLEPKIDNPGDALWVAFNLATVGEQPDSLTTGGKIAAAVLILVGISFITLLTAAFAAAFVHEDELQEREVEKNILLRLEEVEKKLEQASTKKDTDEIKELLIKRLDE